jgi:hypothetical protein
LCRCHRRHRREHAHAPPFSFLTPHHPHLVDVCHAAVVLRCAATPACSTLFPHARAPATHTSTTTRPPRHPGHRVHARRATPWPELRSHHASPPARAPPRRAGAIPGDLGEKPRFWVFLRP